MASKIIRNKVDLAVVLLNYRTPGLVTQCLDSLRDATPDMGGIQVVVVDNDSGDGSAAVIQQWIADCDPDLRGHFTLVESGHNGGFSYGNNAGIDAVEANYYLLINSDTKVRPDALRTLLDHARQRPEAGLIGPRLEYDDGTPQISAFRFHSIITEFMRGAQLSLVDRLLARHRVAIPLEQTAQAPIGWVSFACVLIRAEVIAQVGQLDDGYFMYFEDADFCRRARQMGWQICQAPQARVVHLRGGSSAVKSQAAAKKRLPRYYYESRARYFRKRGGLPALLCANLAWILGRGLSRLKPLLGKPDGGRIESQWRDLWVGLFG